MLKTAAKLLILTLIESLRTYLNQSAFNRALFLVMLLFIGSAVFSFVGLIISEFFLGIPLLSDRTLIEDLSNPALVPALRLLTLLQALGIFILPPVIYLWVSSPKARLRRLFESPVRQSVLISIVFFMIALPLINYLSHWNQTWELPTFVGEWLGEKELAASELTKSFLDMPHAGFLILNLIMIALLPAVGEELLFRGIIQSGLQKSTRNPHLAIWLTAILFSAVHFQILGFVPRMLMGAAMGYLFFWSGNLWYPIIAHFTNNASAVILNYGAQHGSINPNIENAGMNNPTVAGFSLLFCLMLLFVFKQFQDSQKLGNKKGAQELL